MKSRESASAQAESVKGAARHLNQEKRDPLLQRYLGAALFQTLGETRRERRSRLSSGKHA